jgi:quercetin dioxygenase-like cupin family protein
MGQREELIALDNARVASIELTIGEESAWHYHTKLVENVVCLNGIIELQCNNPELIIRLRPGERKKINPMHEHRLVNLGKTEATYLLVQSGNYDFVPSNS